MGEVSGALEDVAEERSALSDGIGVQVGEIAWEVGQARGP
jgi:hypothetical protein